MPLWTCMQLQCMYRKAGACIMMPLLPSYSFSHIYRCHCQANWSLTVRTEQIILAYFSAPLQMGRKHIKMAARMRPYLNSPERNWAQLLIVIKPVCCPTLGDWDFILSMDQDEIFKNFQENQRTSKSFWSIKTKCKDLPSNRKELLHPGFFFFSLPF